MAAGHFVQILPRGQRFAGPKGVIPVAAGEPMAGGRGIGKGLDLGQHLRQRLHTGQVHVQLGLSGAAQMDVGVVEAGKDKDAGGVGPQVAEPVFGSCKTFDLLVGAYRQHFAAANRHGLHGLRLAFGETNAGVDDAVIEDDFRIGAELDRRSFRAACGGRLCRGSLSRA